VTKAVLERALAEEMTGHLGYEKHDPAGRGSGNNRNGTTRKTVLTNIGAVDLVVPHLSRDLHRRPHGQDQIRDGVIANRPVYLAIGDRLPGRQAGAGPVGRAHYRGVGQVLAHRLVRAQRPGRG